ncbi:hypothetical protein P8452_22714 [Trifolium repens]|nr:hypothetical protein P8452_22714 [Trifolium repens]
MEKKQGKEEAKYCVRPAETQHVRIRFHHRGELNCACRFVYCECFIGDNSQRGGWWTIAAKGTEILRKGLNSQCEQQHRQQQRENNDTAKSLNSDLEKRTRRFEGGSDSR